MKRRYHTLLSCIVLGALAVAGSALAGDTWREMSEQVVDAAKVKTLDVNNPRGIVSVSPSTDGKIHLSALKIVRTGNEKKGRELASQMQVEAGVQGDRYAVRVTYPHRKIHVNVWDVLSGGDIDVPSLEVRLVIKAPVAVTVLLKSTSGDLESDAMSGRQQLETTSGDVRVPSARGPLSVRASSGDLEIGDVMAARLSTSSGEVNVDRSRGPLRVGTTSGDITVESADDSLAITTASGDVKVSQATRGADLRSTSGGIDARAAGSVRAETASGDATLTLLSPLVQADIATVSGDIEARLAHDVACRLEMHTTSGSLDATVPIDLSQATRREIVGSVRNGSIPVRLRSTSGDINVTD